MEYVKIKPNQQFGNLVTRWSWNSRSGRVWKCGCSCGGYCYVKEYALQNDLVHNCGDVNSHQHNREIKKQRNKFPKYPNGQAKVTLEKIMLKRDLLEYDISKLTDVHIATIHSILKGISEPQKKTIVKLASGLGVQEVDFI